VTEWYEHWFGEEYLDLYPHRDDREAEQLVTLLGARGVVRSGAKVLDLACGAGRHAAALAHLAARVVGFDLSLTLLRAAQRRGAGSLVRGDMRVLAFRDGAFNAVVNLFTSFGYFDRDEQHLAVLQEVARVLAPGGRFAMDFLNAAQVRQSLVRRNSGRLGGQRVVQERRLSEDGRFVIKTIALEGEGRQFMERVRLYERGDLEAMARTAGLRVLDVLGDYEGAPHTPSSSRCLILAERP
jgi:SAM-dependent methyltransferase